jgi:alkanesulfonate monooxygenase SsuD/methylene tetrahydromethanopterin reductase-like flavin-dependent oxidoreductase (luciferase family)
VDIGVGLPSTMRGVPAATVMAWARRADELGFSTLGSVDRVVYANYEMIPTLGAAAAVTERIRLTTSICWRRCVATARCWPNS